MREYKLKIANSVINSICPEKDMEEIYCMEGLQPYPHKNIVTGREYQGLNRFALELSMLLNDFEKPEWATFPQFKSIERHINKGAKSTKILLAIHNKKKDETTQEEKEVLNFFKGGSVFNVAQTTGD